MGGVGRAIERSANHLRMKHAVGIHVGNPSSRTKKRRSIYFDRPSIRSVCRSDGTTVANPTGRRAFDENRPADPVENCCWTVGWYRRLRTCTNRTKRPQKHSRVKTIRMSTYRRPSWLSNVNNKNRSSSPVRIESNGPCLDTTIQLVVFRSPFCRKKLFRIRRRC